MDDNEMAQRSVPLFQRLGYLLNMFRLFFLTAALRWLALRLAGSRAVEKQYSTGGSVFVYGYAGWIETPRFGVLAFRRTDGSLQYRW